MSLYLLGSGQLLIAMIAVTILPMKEPGLIFALWGAANIIRDGN